LTLKQSAWKTYEYSIPDEVGEEVILLLKVSRTWNPLKTFGTPDPRNLGVAIGKIQFKDNRTEGTVPFGSGTVPFFGKEGRN